MFMAEEETQILIEREELSRIIGRMAHEVIERAASLEELVLVGIRSRGVHLARRIAKRIQD